MKGTITLATTAGNWVERQNHRSLRGANRQPSISFASGDYCIVCEPTLSLHNCRGCTPKKNAGKTATDWPVANSFRRRLAQGATLTQDGSELLKKALAFPVAKRAELAGSLIESLDRTEDESVEAAWDEEIGRRMADLDSGGVQPVSAEEARRRLSSAIE